MANTRGTKPTDRGAETAEDESSLPMDTQIRTMGAPGQPGPAVQSGSIARPNWDVLMQRFGGAPTGGATPQQPQQGAQPAAPGGFQRPQWGGGGGMGAPAQQQMQGPWGQHIQQALQALAQRFSQRRPGMPQGGRMAGPPGSLPMGGAPQPGGVVPPGWGQGELT